MLGAGDTIELAGHADACEMPQAFDSSPFSCARCYMRGAWWAIIAVAVLAGCGDTNTSSSSGNSGGKKLRIAVIPKGTSHEFWKSVHAGAKKAAEEAGNVEIVWQGPASESDINQQISIVEQMVLQGVDGIILAPNHSQSLVPVVQGANDAKIPVVVFDSGLDAGAEIVSYVATDNENGGRLAAERLAEVLGGKGNVILMRYRAGSESTEMREKGFLDKLQEYPDIKVLSSDQYAEGTPESAKAKAEQLLLQFKGEVDGFFAVCEPNANGALLAIENQGGEKKIKFIAFDPSRQLIQGLKDGSVHGIILQDPVQMGYLSVKALLQHLDGQEVEKRIPTGEYVATKENMDTEKIQTLLQPVQQE
jgi:ribose transport system substrate-binding protein